MSQQHEVGPPFFLPTLTEATPYRMDYPLTRASSLLTETPWSENCVVPALPSLILSSSYSLRLFYVLERSCRKAQLRATPAARSPTTHDFFPPYLFVSEPRPIWRAAQTRQSPACASTAPPALLFYLPSRLPLVQEG